MRHFFVLFGVLMILLADSALAAVDLAGYPTFDVVQSTAAAGSTVTVNFRVANYGNSASGAFAVRFFLSADATIDPAADYALSGHTSISSIPAGTASGFGVTLTLPAQDALAALGGAGSYYIGMVVDSLGQVSEYNEGNNRNVGTGTDRDTLSITIPQPDLIGWDGRSAYDEYFGMLSSNLVWGDALHIRWAVFNQTGGNAGVFNVKFYLSTDATITSSDYLLGTSTFSSGLPGLGYNGSHDYTLILPSVNPFGGGTAFYVGMMVDADNQAAESNEGNNASQGPGKDYAAVTVLPPQPSIMVTDSVAPNNDMVVAFGSVANDGPSGARGVQTVTVANNGKASLTMNSLALSGSPYFSIVEIASSTQNFINPSSLPRVIAKGGAESWVITLQFDPAATGAATGTLTINSDDPNTPSRAIALTGTGEPVPDIALATAEAAETDFGGVVQDGAGGFSALRTVTLKNVGSGPLTVSQNGLSLLTGTHFSLVSITSSTQGAINLASGSRTIAAGGAETWDVVLKFDPSATGLLKDGLKVLSDDPDESTFTVSLTGTGLLPMHLSITDSSGSPTDRAIAYPNVHADGAGKESASASVTLTNTGEAALTIAQNGLSFLTGTHFKLGSVVSSTAGPVDLSAGAKSLAGNSAETWTVTLLLDPSTGGALTDTFRIASNDPALAVGTVSLSGTGLTQPGLSIADSVEPAGDYAVPFGAVLNDGSGNRKAQQTVVLKNLGTQPLVVSQNGIAIAGSSTFQIASIVSSTAGAINVASSSASARTLAATQAETWTVTLVFDPTTNASATGSLDISSNDPVTPVAHVALTGQGAQPSITLTAPSLALNLSAGSVYEVTWDSAYAAGDATIALYLGTDNDPSSGLLPIVSGLSYASGVKSYSWRPDPALAGGSYYLYATIADGSVTKGSYAPGKVKIDPVGSFKLRSGQEVTSSDYAFEYEYNGQIYTGVQTLTPGSNVVNVTTTLGDGTTVTNQFTVNLVPTLTHIEAQTHDKLNRVETTKNGNGIITTITYDQMSRVIRRSSTNGAVVEFQYDVLGRRTQMSDYTGYTFYEWDDLSRMTAVIKSKNSTKGDNDDLPLRYEYDVAGHRAAIIYPGGERIEYTYDDAGRMKTVNNVTRSLLFTYSYDATTGQLKKLTRPNGIDTIYSFDGNGRITTIRHQRAADASVVAEFFYTLDAAGKATELRTTLSGNVIRREKYGYDRFDRLIQVIYADDGVFDANDKTVKYSYDENGNRSSRVTTANGGVVEMRTYTYGNEGRLLKVLDESGITLAEYHYDSAGNRTQKVTPTRTVVYSYDERNLLVSSSDGTFRCVVEYDGNGQRIARSYNGARRTFINDPTLEYYDAVQEMNAAGTITSASIFANTRLAFFGTQLAVEIADRLSSTCQFVDANGNIVSTFRSDAFGSTSESSSEFRFAEMSFQPELELYFCRSRYYDADVGAFISKDPLGVSAGTNAFSYCAADPVNKTDPSGAILEYIFDDPATLGTYEGRVNTLSAFQDHIEGKTLFEVNSENLKTNFPPGLRGPEHDFRYVQSPSNSSAVLDMRHLLVVGQLGEGAGLLIESGQYVAGQLGFKRQGASAFNSADFLSNSMGQTYFDNFYTPLNTANNYIKTLNAVPSLFGYENVFGPTLTSSQVFNYSFNQFAQAITPPPSPNIGSYLGVSSRVGGVLLDKAATLVGSNLSDLRGAVYDPSTGQFVFLGSDIPAAVKDINLDYLYTALQAVYGSAVPPFVTLDPPASAYTQWADLGDGDGVFEPGENGGFILRYNPIWSGEDTTVDVIINSTWSGTDYMWTARFNCVQQNISSGDRKLMKLVFDSWVVAPPAGVTLDTAPWQSNVFSQSSFRLSADGQDSFMRFTLNNASSSNYIVNSVRVFPARQHRKFGGRVEGSKLGWVMLEADRVMKCLSVGKDNLTGAVYSSGNVNVSGFKNMPERVLATGGSGGNIRMWFVPKDMTLKRHLDSVTGRASIVFDSASVALNTESFLVGLPQPAEAKAFADHFTANYDAFAGLSFPCVDPDDPTGTNVIQVKIFDMLRDVMRAVSLARFFRDNNVPVDTWWLNSWQPPFAYSPKTTPTAYNTVSGIVIFGGCQIAKPNSYVPSASAKSVADVVQSSHPEMTGKPSGDLKEQVWSANTAEGNLKAVATSANAEPQDGGMDLAEVDLNFASPGALPLQFTRFYQSSWLGQSNLGPGWRVTPFVIEFQRPSWYDENSVMLGPDGQPVAKGANKDTHLRSGAVRVVDLRSGSALDFDSSVQLGYTVDNIGNARISVAGLDANGLPTFTPGQRQSGATLVQLKTAGYGYKLTTPEGTELTFDSEGRLLTTKDRNGQVQTCAYDASGALQTITDAAGQVVTCTYNTNGTLKSVSGPAGEQVNYTYTAEGCLDRATHVRSGAYVQYHYNTSKQLDKKTRFNGLNAFASQPDLKGRQEATADVRGNAANKTFTQDTAGTVRTTKTTDPMISDPAFQPWQQQFDRGGRVLMSKDATGATTSFGYDAGSLAPNAVNLPMAGRPTIKIQRNEQGQPTRITDPGNTGAQDVTATYDAATKQLRTLTDPSGAVSELIYDGNKRVQRARAKHNGQNVDTVYGYYTSGAVKTVTDPLGKTVSTIGRDTLDRVTSVTDATGVTIGYEYDSLGRLWKVTDPRLSSKIEYVYDNFDRVVEVRTPAGSIFYGYDPVKGWLISVTDVLGRVTQYVRDPATGDILQVVEKVTGGTDRVTSMTRNRFGQLASLTPPGAAPITFQYDDLGRPIGSAETSASPLGAPKNLSSSRAVSGSPTMRRNHIFRWGAPDSDVAITGYSYAIDGAPSQTVNALAGAATASVNNVSTGSHTFQVKAVDANGRWGAIATFNLVIAPFTPWEQWRANHFTDPELDNNNLSGEMGNIPKDGVVNLIKYALNLDPKQSSSASTSDALPGLPRFQREGANLTLTYQRDSTKSDITYQVEVCSDLNSWSTTGFSEQITGTSGNISTIKATWPQASPGFMHLRVTK